MMRSIFAAALCILAATPAFAGESAWTEVAPDTRLRLISDDKLADGKTWAALEIDMPAAMKTYWRIPGESGIPTEIGIAGSKGITGETIVWPYPSRAYTAGFFDFVYKGHTVLPVHLDVSAGKATLAADIIMGICDEVCVPVKTSLTLPLDFSKPDIGNGLRIQQARAEAPLPWEGPEAAIGAPVQDAATGTVHLAIDPEVVDPNSVIIDTGSPNILFGPPQNGPDGDIVSFPLLGNGKPGQMRGTDLRVTFLTGEGAYETTRTLGSVRQN